MQTLLNEIREWSYGKDGIRFAVVPEGMGCELTKENLSICFRNPPVKHPEVENTVILEYRADQARVSSIAIKNVDGKIELEEWSGQRNEIDDYLDKSRWENEIQGGSFSNVILLGFHDLGVSEFCENIIDLRGVSGTASLIFCGPYLPETYAKYWRDHDLTTGASPWQKSASAIKRYTLRFPDIYTMVDKGNHAKWSEMTDEAKSGLIMELVKLTNADFEIVRWISKECHALPDGICNLSEVCSNMVHGGSLPEIFQARYERLGEKLKKIFIELIRNEFFYIKANAGRVDENLALVEPLFINGLANINTTGDGHILTPFSPLCQLIVRKGWQNFGLCPNFVSFHYDVNHATAARLVNKIENFFRDRLKVFILDQGGEQNRNIEEAIEELLRDFTIQETGDYKLCRFIENTTLLDKETLASLTDAMKDSKLWKDKNRASMFDDATRKKNQSLVSDDFSSEGLDLLYFLDFNQIQQIFLEKNPLGDLLAMNELSSFFEFLKRLRNDVSHNRPVAYDRLVRVETKFERIKKQIGKGVGQSRG